MICLGTWAALRELLEVSLTGDMSKLGSSYLEKLKHLTFFT